MIARVAMTRRAIAGVVLSTAVVQLMAIGGAQAADPPQPGPLDRPIADLALIDAVDAGLPPMLLTLDTVDLPPGTVRVELLDRATDWQPAASQTTSLLERADRPETPWLIEVNPGRFVIIGTSHEAGRTMLAPVRVAPAGGRPLEIGRAISVDMAVDDAGAVDVDGDGTVELVVSSAVTRRGGDVCQGSVVRVLDGTTLSHRAEWRVPDMRLAGGVLGEWDGQPGADLMAYTYGNCPAGPDSARRLGVYALRLADGTTIAALSPEDPAGSTASPGVPVVADFDGDGRDEVVIRDGAALAILEPARGWARTEVARGEVMPLLAAAPEAAGQFGSLIWLAYAESEANLVAVLARIARGGDGSFAVTQDRLDLAAVPPARRGRVLTAMRDVAVAQSAPQAWRGEIDGDSCADVLAPLLTIQCITDPDASLEVGATWFATRPVTAYQAGASRELLIAATMEWDPSRRGPQAATPAAVAPAGAWRHGPSPRFALSEVRAADAAYFSLFPVPRPTIEGAPVRAQATDFPGFTGARVLLRVVSARLDDPPPSVTPILDAFLWNPPSTGEMVSVARIPVPAGAESGRDGSFVHVSLTDVPAPDDGPAERWTVTIAQINDWGEIAGPVRGTIVRDSSGPSLTVEAPFLSLPWPFEATVHGRSEPNVEVRGGSGGPVTSDRRGRFELKTPLAPWPQSVELRAVDESGNVTTRQFSLVGGVDYRAFPWPAILVVLLLLGAILSAGRGMRPAGETEELADSEPLPEIEELPSARVRS